MTTETLSEMIGRWEILMAARDPKTNERIAERDYRYNQQCIKLRVQIEDRKLAEANSPQISEQQLAQLQWLERARAAHWTDKEGNPTSRVHEPHSKFAERLDRAQQLVYAGGDISTTIAGTEAEFAKQGVKMPEAVERSESTLRERQIAAEQSRGAGTHMPPPHHYTPMAQPILTTIPSVK
jgi:hypothetical protein